MTHGSAGSIGSMAGEASGNLQSRWQVIKEKQAHLTWWEPEEEKEPTGMCYPLKNKNKTKPNKTKTDLMRTLSEQQRGMSAPMIQSPPTRPLLQYWELQFNMRFGWGHRAKPYHSAPGSSQISSSSTFQNHSCLSSSPPKSQLISALTQKSTVQILI